jgi:tetratricopeptide (TPR) repeat protein
MRATERTVVGATWFLALAAAACAGRVAVRAGAAPVPAAAPAGAEPAPPTPVPPAATDSAAQAARRAVEDSSRAEALVARGMAALRQNRDSEAAGDFRAALRLRPRLGRALGGLAETEAQARDFPDALALADSAAALGDTDAFVTSLRGRLGASMGRCPEAVAILLPFERAHPEWTQATPELAYCLLRLERAPEAVTVMQVAVREEPRAPPLQWALMEAFVATQQLDSALAHAVYLKEHYPENGLWWIETGRVLVLLNRMSEARLVFERGFQLRPGLADSLSRIDRRAWEAVQSLRGSSPP